MNEVIWRAPKLMWVLLITAIIAVAFSLQDSLQELMRIWGSKEEYSYGYIIPFIAIFLLWQKKDTFQKLEFKGSWLGLILALVSFFVYLV
ncbi:MAG: exosortase/archaeosortase family protein, partial [Gammaproteobacteria bacterium]|nr:exosortase/archaeosortase family protein [Gammaproteobacteria bacterium]